LCNTWCISFIKDSTQYWTPNARLLDVGSMNIGGSPREGVKEFTSEYIGIDMRPGPDVDRVMKGEDILKNFGRDSFDVVSSTEMFEHARSWTTVIYNMMLALKPDGIMAITCRAKGFGRHEFPGDYWRFEQEDFQKILEPMGTVLKLESDPDSWRGWNGTGVVFRKNSKPATPEEEEKWLAFLNDLPIFNMDYDRITFNEFEEKTKESYDGRPLISLVMIVKDEAKVLEKCLESVKPIVDEFVIVDSVASYSPVVLKIDGMIEIMSLEELFLSLDAPIKISDKGEEIKTCPLNIYIWNRMNGHRNGSWTEIKYVLRHKYNGKLVRVNTLDGVIDVTPNHSLFKTNGRVVEAENVSVGEKLLQGELKNCHKAGKKHENKIFNGTSELAWCFGFFAAEGCTTHKHKSRIIKFSNKKIELLKRCRDAIEKELNITCQKINLDSTGLYSLTCGGEQIYSFFDNKFYNSNREKKIPREILNAPDAIRRAFLDGYMAGDGHYYKEKFPSFTSKSWSLAQGILWLWNSFDYNSAVVHVRDDKENIVQISVNLTNKRRKIPNEIKKIRQINYSGMVYDISTKDGKFQTGVGCIFAHNTGSTDGTQEIIKRYGELHEVPFTNFVDSKNNAMSYATGKYILLLDADKTIISGLEFIKEHIADDVDCLYADVVEGARDNPTSVYLCALVWKNNGKWKFAGPGVHEVITGEGSTYIDHRIKVLHEHDPATRNRDYYLKRFNDYADILKNYMSTHPNDPRGTFYLGRTLKDLQQWQDAITQFQRYLALNTNFRDERWQAAYDIAECWKVQGEYDRCEEALALAEEIDPRRAETHVLHGILYYELQDFEESAKWFEKAVALPVPQDVLLFLELKNYFEIPTDYLVLVYDKIKEYRKGYEHAKKLAERIKKPDFRISNNLMYLRKLKDKTIFFLLGVTPEPVYGGMIEQQGVGGVETTYLELPAELAKLGHKCYVFCVCDKIHEYKGVTFIPYIDLYSYTDLKPDVVITSRWFDPLYVFRDAKKIAWMQDAHYADPNHEDAWQVIDALVCSSRWHRHYTGDRLGNRLDAKKINVIPLAIRGELFEQQVERDPLQVIYSSNPSRGLYVLQTMWDEICQKVPGIHLVVTYGWEGLKTWSDDPGWQAGIAADEKRVTDWVEKAGNIRVTGRLAKKELAREMLASSLCLYPNDYPESFCAHPDSEVFTESGYKSIKDITRDDKVLTHLGRFKTVIKTMNRDYSGNLIKLSLQNNKNDCSMFTPEHPVLVLDKNEARRCYCAGLGVGGYSKSHLKTEPEWKAIGSIKKGDYICVPVPLENKGDKEIDLLADLQKISSEYNTSEDGRIRGIERGCGSPLKIQTTNDFARFLGLYFAEGCTDLRSTIIFAFNTKEKQFIKFVSEFATSILGLSKQANYVAGNSISVKFSGAIFSKWLEYQFGSGARNKNVPPFIYKQDKEFIRSFVLGVIEGDGNWGTHQMKLEMGTRLGIKNIRELLLSLGISSSLCRQESHNSWSIGVSEKQWNALLGESDTSDGFSCLRHNNQWFYKVKNIFEIPYTGKVYNLEVEEDNSYICDFMAVHNCLTGLETQAAGVPMITTRLGALTTTLGNNGNVLISDNPHSEEYAKKFINATVLLMTDREKLKYLSDNCLTFFKQQPDWAQVALMWEKLIYHL